ncbi:MAG: hypothetical protein QM820_15120 [Minicystis sp.]
MADLPVHGLEPRRQALAGVALRVRDQALHLEEERGEGGLGIVRRGREELLPLRLRGREGLAQRVPLRLDRGAQRALHRDALREPAALG